MRIFTAIGMGVAAIFVYGALFGGRDRDSVVLEPTRPNVVGLGPNAVLPPPAATPPVGAVGAGASSGPSKAEWGELIATAINLNGYLCASVESVVPLALGGGNKVFEVECIEYRSGRGRVHYLVDTRDNSVRKQ